MVFIFYMGKMQKRQVGKKLTPKGKARMGWYRSVHYVTSSGKVKKRYMRCHESSGDLFAKSKTWGPKNYLGGEDKVYSKAHREEGKKEALDMARKIRKESAKNRRKRNEVPLEPPRLVHDDEDSIVEDEPEPPKPKKQKKQKRKRRVIQLNPNHPDYDAKLVEKLRSGKIKF